METIKLTSIAPFRTPINLYSELLCPQGFQQVREELASLITSDLYTVTSVDWPFGYGSLNHDSLPEFFQPIARLCPSESHLTKLSKGTVGDALINVEIYLYDDTFAVLFAEWRLDEIPNHRSDHLLTKQTNRLIADLVCSVLQPLSDHFRTSGVPSSLWRDAKNFSIYTDMASALKLPQSALWVARAALMNNHPEDFSPWLEWAGIQETDKIFTSSISLYAGSGNCILTGIEEEADCTDFVRAMSMCQLYSALLSTYQQRLAADLKTLEKYIKDKGVVRAKNNLLRQVEKRLDHLDWVRLKHEQALYGTQSVRRKLVHSIHHSWNTEGQFHNIKGWMDLLRERISRQFNEQQARQGKLIRTLLSVIGGLSILDIALLLSKDSHELPKDTIPGLLDLFQQLPPDMVLYVAILILVIFAFVARKDGS